jgi:leader peptidase (prepilin peptidase)/N-methyltransferase
LAADPAGVPERLFAAAGAGGFLLLAALAYPGGMGMGDVKLAAVVGLYLGSAVVPAMLVAVLAGALVGLVMIVRHGTGERKRAIPFGPFLALGGVVGLFAGDQIPSCISTTSWAEPEFSDRTGPDHPLDGAPGQGHHRA